MSKYLYKSDDKRITFYPQLELISFAMVLGGILLLCLALFIFSINSTTIALAIISGSAIFPITCILLIFARSTQVIIDIESKKIIKKTLMAEKEIATFDNVKDIELIQDSKSPYINIYKYIINLHKAPYTIELTHSLRKKCKNMKIFEQGAIKTLKEAIAEHQITSNVDIADNEYSYEYFKPSRRDCYTYQQKNTSLIAIGIFLLVCIVYVVLSENAPKSFLFLSSICFLLIFIRREISIDTFNRTISYSYNGIFSRNTAQFDDIISIKQGIAKTINFQSGVSQQPTIEMLMYKKGEITAEILSTETSQAKTLGILKEISVLTGIPIKKD